QKRVHVEGEVKVKQDKVNSLEAKVEGLGQSAREVEELLRCELAESRHAAEESVAKLNVHLETQKTELEALQRSAANQTRANEEQDHRLQQNTETLTNQLTETAKALETRETEMKVMQAVHAEQLKRVADQCGDKVRMLEEAKKRLEAELADRAKQIEEVQRANEKQEVQSAQMHLERE
ncbi:hypothetical protein HDU98_006144, partial [Podochytrium sp. JEL0797]